MTINIEQSEAAEWLRGRLAKKVDLVIGSPPYALKGKRYGDKSQPWPVDEWVKWMAEVTIAATWATRGWVIWVANGAVRKGEYQPACEGLIWTLRNHPRVAVERPCIWHKNATPTRKGEWFSNDWEFILAFYRKGFRPQFDWEAIAHKPKYLAGGDFRQRDSNGTRRKGGAYPNGKLAMPRDVIRCTVGGGHLGSKLAHEHEAPYPEELIRPFIKACCPAGGIVADPFSGSGTTASVAIQEGRSFVGCDLKPEHVELTKRRIAEAQERMAATSNPKGEP